MKDEVLERSSMTLAIVKLLLMKTDGISITLTGNHIWQR